MIQTRGYTHTADLILALSYFNTKISMTYNEETLSLKTMLTFTFDDPFIDVLDKVVTLPLARYGSGRCSYHGDADSAHDSASATALGLRSSGVPHAAAFFDAGCVAGAHHTAGLEPVSSEDVPFMPKRSSEGARPRGAKPCRGDVPRDHAAGVCATADEACECRRATLQ